MGAWIETGISTAAGAAAGVAPYVGAWIETLLGGVVNNLLASRTLRGCVD